MAVNYTIRADIIDIGVDVPQPNDVFLVDSNVWYWLTYTNASLSANSYQVNSYPSYIHQALSSKSKLLRCGLSLAEMAHIIERSEREIFERSNHSITAKEYRHNHPAERAKVSSEIQLAWNQVKGIAEPIEILVDDTLTDTALNKFSTHTIDGYDLFILEAISKAGVAKILTDDGDFSTIPGIQIFTCNKNVIMAAKAQKKLILR